MEPKVTLAQAIHELRSQLAEAAMEGRDAAIRFIPKSVEVELGIAFDVETEAGGGFKLLSLIDISGKTKATGGSTHKVKLTLEPIGRDGKQSLLIRDHEREKD